MQKQETLSKNQKIVEKKGGHMDAYAVGNKKTRSVPGDPGGGGALRA